MKAAMSETGPLQRLFRMWPWAVLLLTAVPAVWHVIDFPDEQDPEYPRVVRPTFSRRPPPSYRLAEPGDTIDRVGLYISAAALVLAAWGWGRSRALGGSAEFWPVACSLAL